MYYAVTENTGLANTETLLLGKIRVPVSLWSKHFCQLLSIFSCVLLSKDIFFNITSIP